MNPLVKVAKALGLFTATEDGRVALRRMGFRPGSMIVCCERGDTVLNVSERSRHSAPPAFWAYLDDNDKLRLIVVEPVTDSTAACAGQEPQPFGPEATVEMLAHVAHHTGENYFRVSEWDALRRAEPVADRDLENA